ncbi:MAG TPA: lysophospholipid acyltransferase family protein, partial [Gemmatimonadaceae bacterium]|nr:lysophospholipid acyltransferase family protein [Gemmatimonadaceae bacterium]
MLYALLRAAARVALRWYYRDIHVEGAERIPRRRPLLLVVNHPNALIDALVIAWAVPRRVLITAKATLFGNPVGAALLRAAGVVPLRRASDEAAPGQPIDAARNVTTFRAVHEALRRGGAVLIFPEGRTHDEPSLAPLKTGAARMALHATSAGDVPGLSVVPIGLTFERKDRPRTRVFVLVGEPILMDAWHPPAAHLGVSSPEALTAEIDTRLRAVTLNYSTADDAARAVRLASLMASLFGGVPAIGAVDRRLGVDASIARRIDVLTTRLASANAALRLRAATLIRRLDDLERAASARGARLDDIEMSVSSSSALQFVLREGRWLALGGPFAVWGRINHWLPFRAARAVASRSIESAADPAMRTL